MQTDQLDEILGVEGLHWRLSNSCDGQLFAKRPTLRGQLGLLAAVELACVGTQWAGSQPFLQLVGSASPSVSSLMRQLQWPHCNPGRRARAREVTLIALPQASSDTRWTGFLHDLQAELRAHGFRNRLSASITGAVGEMADNVWEHSGAPISGLVGYAIGQRRVDFVVADLGDGVMKSLRRNPMYRFVNTSMEALEKAVLDGVSRFEDQSRGYGFSSLLRALANLWGFARLRSGQAALTFDRRSERHKRLQRYVPPLPGTQVFVSCGLDSSHPSPSKRS